MHASSFVDYLLFTADKNPSFLVVLNCVLISAVVSVTHCHLPHSAVLLAFALFTQVWVKSSTDISPFVFEKASGTEAGVPVGFCVFLLVPDYVNCC